MALQHLRSSTANKRPIPSVMSAGQLAVNTNEASPGLFFKNSNGDLVKVGPVHIGANAPNSSPDSVAATALVTGTVYQILVVGTSDFTLVGASANTAETVFTATGTTTGTGTVSGQQGNEKGEMWLDNTGGNYVLKIYDGTAWRSEAGEFVNVTGDTMTGDLVFNNADIVFEGSTADAFETTLTVVDPTADRTITLPNVTGTVVTTGDTGSVTSTMITDGTIVNADVNASAAIAGTKISPDFGSQNVLTTGNVGIGTSSPASLLHISSTVDTALKVQAASAVPTIELLRGNNTGFGTDATYDYRLKNEAGKLTIQNGVSSTISDLLTIDNLGNVGIGNTDPDEILTVGNTTTNNIIRMRAGATSVNGLDFGDANDADVGRIRYSHSDNSLAFTTNAAERMRINSSGNVGIGTSSPDVKLHVSDSAISQSWSDNAADLVKIEGTVKGINFVNSTTGFIAFSDAVARGQGVIEYTHSSDSMQFRTSGSEKIRITSIGNVGIGTNDPQSLLHLTSTSPRITLTDTNTGADHRINADSSVGNLAFDVDPNSDTTTPSLVFNIKGGEKMRINSSGNVGIGTTNPLSKLQVDGSIAADGATTAALPSFAFDNDVDTGMYQVSSNTLGFATGGARRVSIGSTSFFAYTTTTPSSSNSGVQVTSTGILRSRSSQSSATNTAATLGGTLGSMNVKADGDCENTNGRYTQASDERIKENIVEASSQWEDIKNLRWVNYNYKPETNMPQHTQLGVVAQEAELVCPGVITTSETPETDWNDELKAEVGDTYKGVAYSVIAMKAAKALQEAIAKIETLETKVAALEAG